MCEYKIKFEYEKHFKWLCFQSLDFYLPEYNVAIECQGVQHFQPCNFGSKTKTATEMFNYVKKCDIRKYNACTKNGIKLSGIYFSNKKSLIKQIIKNGKIK